MNIDSRFFVETSITLKFIFIKIIKKHVLQLKTLNKLLSTNKSKVFYFSINTKLAIF